MLDLRIVGVKMQKERIENKRESGQNIEFNIEITEGL